MSTGLRRTTWQRPRRITTPLVDGRLRGAVRELVNPHGAMRRTIVQPPDYRRESPSSGSLGGARFD